MKKIQIENFEYEIIEDKENCFSLEEVKERMTDYFDDYDYIFGDYAYDKLRLKGFYDEANKKATEINNIKNVSKYVEEYCAYGAKYFILKKIK